MGIFCSFNVFRLASIIDPRKTSDSNGRYRRCRPNANALLACFASTYRTRTLRKLATLLRLKPKMLFKSLGGYQAKKKHRIVLSGMPYAFPKLGNIIVPFQVARDQYRVISFPITDEVLKSVRSIAIDVNTTSVAMFLFEVYFITSEMSVVLFGSTHFFQVCVYETPPVDRMASIP